MDQTIHLIPLICPNCSTPIPAEPHEAAWACGQCGQGLALHSDKGLQTVAIQYQKEIPPGRRGRPYWMTVGKVQLEREAYRSKSGAREEAQAFWSAPRRFFIPAFPMGTETLLQTGVSLLVNPPTLIPGAPVPFEPVTLGIEDIQPVAEFIIMAIEAGRKDSLKRAEIQLDLSAPTMWILP